MSFMLRGVVGLLMLLLFLFSLLHIPSIQRLITATIVTRLTENINAKMTIADASFDVISGITLQEISIYRSEEMDVDTLANINFISLSPKGTLISLVRGDLSFSDLTIRGVDIRYQHLKDEALSNWQKALHHSSSSQGSSSQRMPAFLSYLRLEDCHIWIEDRRSGLLLDADLASIELAIDRISEEDTLVVQLDRIVLVDPVIDIHSLSHEVTTTDTISIPDIPQERKHLLIGLHQLSIVNGNISIARGDGPPTQVKDLTLLINDVNYRDELTWDLVLQNFAVKYNSDALRHLSASSISRSQDVLRLDDVHMRMNRSYINMDVVMSEVDPKLNVEDANFDIDLKPSKIYLQDLYRLIPSLSRTFGRDPVSRMPVQLGGKYHGNIGKGLLDARDISVWVGDDHHFLGNFYFEEGPTRARSIVNAEVKELKSNMNLLNSLSAKLKVPQELMRLGDISFRGSYDGYVSDFVANGSLETSLGRADMDIQFDLSGAGEEAITYAGLLILDDFDMAGFMNNDDFGLVDARVDITNGIGSNLPSSTADLRAVISRISFKDYVYQDAIYEGQLSSRVINGRFSIDDPNMDLEFEGIVDLSNAIPLLDFNILVNNIDFCHLNITKFPCQVSFASDISFRGSGLSTMEGRGSIGDIDLVHDSVTLHIDNINIRSARIQHGMQFEMTSDFVDLNIAGEFNLLKMYDHTVDQLLHNTKSHNATWKIKREMDTTVSEKFSYAVYLKDINPLLAFVGQDIAIDQQGTITGSLDTYTDKVALQGTIPRLRYKDIQTDSLTINLKSTFNELDLVLGVRDFERGPTSIQEGSIAIHIRDEFLDWHIYGLNNLSDRVSLKAQSKVEKEGYFTRITEQRITIDNNEWHFLPNDGFGIYPREILFDSLTLTDGEVYISLNDKDGRGLEVGLNDFQLGFINSLINYEKLEFAGEVNSTFRIVDVFEDRSMFGFLQVDSFLINGDNYGTLNLNAQRGDQGVIDIDLGIKKDTQNLYVVGYADVEKKFINADITLEDYPMRFFEYIIEEGISETQGTTDIQAKLYGPLSDLKMSAKGLIKNAGVKVDFLGAFYRMENQEVKLDEKFIDFSGVQLIDEMGNTAIISGGLEHNLLADIRANLSISAPRFIGLNTTEDDNPLYYGIGVGKIDISFRGPFDAINIRVNAIAGRLSQLYIPINSTEYGYDEAFIKFDYQKNEIDSVSQSTLKELLKDRGADFEMNLTFTPDARVSVIYDEETSNVLNGSGAGNIRIRAKRDGEFTIHGDYEVSSGDYLFTSYGVIAKKFNIRPGGIVKWTGDPINASLNLTAEYPGLRAPLTNFLLEYGSFLDDGELNQRQDVDLTLILGGTLYQPVIDFNLEFPNLVGPVKTYAQSKLRTLKTSENGINNQVVGLMVFGDFLPDNNPFGGTSFGTVSQTAASTVTQFITSQVSVLLSDYLSKNLDDDSFITGIDFEIATANFSFNNQADGTLIDEVQVNMRNRIRNGDVYVNIGGNYVRRNQLNTNNNYLTGDFSIDWFLTDDRRLKLRFYSNIGFDEARATGRQRYGLGINYRKEFGANSNFAAVLQDLVDDLNKESHKK